MAHSDVMHISELLESSPKNWGKWGPEDEVGALNYLDRAAVLRGAGSIRSPSRIAPRPMTRAGFRTRSATGCKAPPTAVIPAVSV